MSSGVNRRLVKKYTGENINMKFYIMLEPDEEGGFNVTVPALDGCFTQGETEEKAIENAREAIICYFEGLEKVNQIRSKPKVILKEVEIKL
jgi:predicted RNase H-like HicB family nuclease